MKTYTVEVTINVAAESEREAVEIVGAVISATHRTDICQVDAQVVDEEGICDCGEPAVDFPGETVSDADGEVFYCQACHDEAFGKEEAS